VLDWDALVHGPVMQAFGEGAPIQYTISGGATLSVDGVFDEGARAVRVVMEPEVNEVAPVLGIRLAQFPADFDPRNAKGDTFVARGITYVVTDGKPDSHGWAILEATRA